MKNSITYFNARSLFSGIMISYIFLQTGSSFFISYILGTIIGVVLIKMYKINANKYSKVIAITLISFMTFSLLVNMGHSLYLNNTPIWLLTLIPIIGVTIMSNSKTLPFIKVTNVFFMYSLFLFMIAVLGLIPHIDLNNMKPLFAVDAKNIIWCTFVYVIASTTPVICMEDKTDKNSTILKYLLASLSILITSFFAISVLGIEEVKLYRFPEYVVLKRIEFLNFISNADTFINFAIILDIILTFAKGMIEIESETNKTVKYIIIGLIGIGTIYACYENWPMILLYKYSPILLLFLLLILFVPKKSAYKKEIKNIS